MQVGQCGQGKSGTKEMRQPLSTPPACHPFFFFFFFFFLSSHCRLKCARPSQTGERKGFGRVTGAPPRTKEMSMQAEQTAGVASSLCRRIGSTERS